MSQPTLNPDSTINEFVQQDFQRASLFETLGIDSCCGGGKSLKEACLEKQLDPVIVLEKINSLGSGESSKAEPDWQDVPLVELIDHIESTHHKYVKATSPKLLELAEKVLQAHGENHSELQELKETVDALVEDLGPHLMKEEQILFPMLRQMAESLEPGGMVQRPIAVMKMEHEHVKELLEKIDRLTDGYKLPEDACGSYRIYLETLQEFSSDLRVHIHKENDVLFERAG